MKPAVNVAEATGERVMGTRPKEPSMTKEERSSAAIDNQGEGDRRSARHFNEQQREFVESERGREAIADNRELDPAAARRESAAATKAKLRARENDPEETRDYRKPAK
jgi:hypothetical protein